jgi:glyoxylase-like metal-dependent hydrolase (beta-lactamase superfamily II)
MDPEKSMIKLKLSVTNDYIIPIGSRYLLIDTGYEYEWDTFCKQLHAHGIRLPQISHLLLTHHHDDHCGLVNKLHEEIRDLRVIMSFKATSLLATGKNDLSKGGGYINRRVNALAGIKRVFDKRWSLTFPPYIARPNDIIVDNDTSFHDIGIDLDARILCTPGHSSDSICVLLDNGECIVGDAAARFLQFAGTKYCIIFLEDIEEFYRSWEKLIAAGAKRIIPSHGKDFEVEKLARNMRRNSTRNMVMLSEN